MLLLGTPDTGSDNYRAFLFGGIETTALIQIFVSWLFGRTLSKETPERRVRAMRITFVVLGMCMGLVWATMPITLFPPALPNQKVIVACTCAGLIATALAFVPVAGMTESMTVPLGSASAFTLLSIGGRDWLALFGCLTIYGLFIGSVTIHVRWLLDKITVYRLESQEQRSTLQLLSGRSDAGDIWSLWETDKNGFISFLSPDMAQIFNWKPTAEPEQNFVETVITHAIGAEEYASDPDEGKGIEFAHLISCLEGPISFRDIIVPLRIAGKIAHWSFTGRPLFDERQKYCGFRGLAYDVSDTFTERSEEAYQARHDAVTGIPNRHALNEALRNALSDLGRKGTAFALYLVDLDGFKRINDRLGHAAGDAVLQASARRLSGGGHREALVARFGGDEFAVLVQDVNFMSATKLAQEIVGLFANPVPLSDQQVSVHVSVGLAMAPMCGDSVEAIVDAADLAMYHAKQKGKNTWSCFEDAMSGQIEQRRRLLGEFREAVRNREITLAYQPIIDARTVTLVGFEALARWRRDDGSFVPPDRFILLAEEAGLIGELGTQLLGQACQFAAVWPEHLTIAVNVSVGQLHASNFLPMISTTLKNSGLLPSRLELEVTESIFMDANSTCAGVLHGLSDLGVKLVLDDFGRGYSSLGFLKEFSFSKLKLDMGFIRDMIHDRRSAAIVRSVIELAAELGIVVTAEGVETRGQLGILRRYGCTQVQGYLFSPAVSADEALLLAEKSRHSAFHFFEAKSQGA